MKPIHRVLIVAGPLVMMTVCLILFGRAGAQVDQLTVEVLSVQAELGSAGNAEERAKLERDSDRLLYQRHTKETGRGFWAFAAGVSLFFASLALIFVVLEIRHSRRRDRLIRQADA
jgi:hypothetical protein